MTYQAWSISALFWLVFVTTPGPNAVNYISNGMNLPFSRAMIGVTAILTPATAFLILSALGITALIAASSATFAIAKLTGAGFLIYLGFRGWLTAKTPIRADERPARQVYLHALATATAIAIAIATINLKSVAGYLAAFSQFVQPGVPTWEQMAVIMPTTLTLTFLNYTGFTSLGALMGRSALGAVFNIWVRRIMATCFIIYGVLLGLSPAPQLKG